MAIQITPPSPIVFSKDPVVWHFEDDFSDVVPGITAVNTLSVVADVVEGARIIVKWGEKEVIFTASDLPDPTGASIPTYDHNPATHEAYIHDLAACFQNNYFVNEDFTVEPFLIEIPGISMWVLKFYARKSGTQYNFATTRFGDNGVTNLVPGTNTSTVSDNSVFVEIYFGDQDSTHFESIHKAVLELDVNGKASVDISGILHSQLASEIPDFLIPVAMKCRDSRRKYYLRYAHAGGDNFSIGPLQTSEQQVVVLGGFAEKKKGPQSLEETFVVANGENKFLRLHAKTRYVRRDEPVFVSWINFAPSIKNVYAKATLKFADGSALDTNTQMIDGVGQYEKIIFSVGYQAYNLSFFNGTKVVSEYSVQLIDQTGLAVSESVRLVVNYGHEEYVRYFAHVNSWGAIETLQTFGKGSSSWKIFKESAEKVMPYTYNSSESQYVEWNLQYQESGQVATGWIRKKEANYFLDFFISPVKWRLIKGLAYAVAVNSNTIARGTDGDNLYGLTFEYQFQRRFDSISEEDMEGEDVQDYVPANVVIAGTVTVPASSNGSDQRMVIDPYPIAGSNNAISSNAMYVLLQGKQNTLPVGDSTQYYRADGRIMNFKTAVNAAETDPTVPAFAKSLTGIETVFNMLQGLNPGLDVNLFGGQNKQWYVQKMTHPAFSAIPPVVIQRNVAFAKYINLANYLTSYHQPNTLTMDVQYNSLKFMGVEVSASGLLIKVEGNVDREFTVDDRILVGIKDENGNQKVVAIRFESLVTQPEVPDDRPLCPSGPVHYLPLPIEIVNNGKIRIPFHGEGVPYLDWRVFKEKTDAVPLRTGTSHATEPKIYAEFPALPAGTYWVAIAGNQCKSNWDFRQFVLPVDNTIAWADTYPKFDGGVFKTKIINASGQYLTEVFNADNNAQLFSEQKDYVAAVTEIIIPRTGGWPDGRYRINVGALTANITVGTPAVPVDTKLLLHAGWDGIVLSNLLLGAYSGALPAGFNIELTSSNLGFLWNSVTFKLEYEVSGAFVEMFSQELSSSIVQSKITDRLFIFTSPGVDSRYVTYSGSPIHRWAKYRVTATMKNGAAVTGTFQQTFQFFALEIKGNYAQDGRVTSYYQPVIGLVQYNGVNVVNNNTWIPLFASEASLQYNVDGGSTWYSTAANWDYEFTGNVSNVTLLSSSVLNNFPSGTTRIIRLRMSTNPEVVSAPFAIRNLGAPDVTGPMIPVIETRGMLKHMNLQFDGESENWLINDLATGEPPEPGFRFDYMIDNDLLHMTGPLTDYPWASNLPVRILKIKVRNDLVQWDEITYDESKIKVFSDNCSVAVCIVNFQPIPWEI